MKRRLAPACLVGLLFVLVFAANGVDGLAKHPVQSWDAVPPSGDEYPSRLPAPPADAPFAGKRVLMLIGDGVEDHEVIYQHQYFVDRGASVSFASPSGSGSGTAILGDFWRPHYTVAAANLTALVEQDSSALLAFDAVYIPGGTPSSSALRTTPNLGEALRVFWENGGSLRLLGIICSGSELLIESGIFAAPGVESFTGSPASAWPLKRALEHAGLPATRYTGLNETSFVTSYPSPSGSVRAQLVIGRNPNASPFWVCEVSKLWAGIVEEPPLGPLDGVPLRLDSSGYYVHPDVHPVHVASDVPFIPPVSPPPALKPSGDAWRGKNVLLALTSGFLEVELDYIASYFEQRGANLTVACPGWVVDYKKAQAYAFRDPPAMPIYYVDCTTSFGKVSAANVDAIVVPGGTFSVMAVLRNDEDLARLTSKLAGAQRVVALFGEGSQMLLPLRNDLLPLGSFVGVPENCRADINNAGFFATDLETTVDQSVLVGWHGASGQGLLSFAKMLEKLSFRV